MPFVYMVRCADGTLYTGWTTDVAGRVAQHNTGRGARYTRIHRPVMLVYQEEAPDRSTAMRREAAIKKLDRTQKERLIAQAHRLGDETNRGDTVVTEADPSISVYSMPPWLSLPH